MKTLTNQSGSLLIEVLVSIGMLVMFSLAIGKLVGTNRQLITNAKQQTNATALAKEAMEQAVATKYMSWSALSQLAEGTYTIEQSGNAYVFVPDPSGIGETVGDFTRTVTIAPAFRDGTGALADSGTPDALARRITVTVRWQAKAVDRDVVLSSYFTNWQGGV